MLEGSDLDAKPAPGGSNPNAKPALRGFDPSTPMTTSPTGERRYSPTSSRRFSHLKGLKLEGSLNTLRHSSPSVMNSTSKVHRGYS